MLAFKTMKTIPDLLWLIFHGNLEKQVLVRCEIGEAELQGGRQLEQVLKALEVDNVAVLCINLYGPFLIKRIQPQQKIPFLL